MQAENMQMPRRDPFGISGRNKNAPQESLPQRDAFGMG